LSLKSPRSTILSDLLFAKRFRSSRLMRRWLVPVGEHEVAAGGGALTGGFASVMAVSDFSADDGEELQASLAFKHCKRSI
jgi:hypothetical protein